MLTKETDFDIPEDKNIFDDDVEVKDPIPRDRFIDDLVEAKNKQIEKYFKLWEKAEKEKSDILINNYTTRGEIMSKPTAQDLRQLSSDILLKLKSLAEKKKSAAKRKELIRQMVEEKDEELENISLDFLEDMQKDLWEETKKELEEKATEFQAKYEKMVQDAKPDLSPSTEKQISKRQHAQAAVQERLKGVEDPNELVDAFQELASDGNKARGQEAYDLVTNRLRNKGGPGQIQQVEKIRRRSVLNSNEVEKLERHESLQDARYWVDMVAGETLSKAESIHQEGMDPEKAEEYINGSVKGVLDEVMDTVETDKSKVGGAGYEG